MVYGPTPPDGVIITAPVEAPLQETLVMMVVAVMVEDSVIVTGTVIEQPFASVTVTLLLTELLTVMLCDVAPVDQL